MQQHAPATTQAADLPALAELLDALRVVAIPTRTAFRGISVREAAIFDSPNGPSEFSPFVEYDDAEAASWLAAAIDFGWGVAPPQLRDRIAVNATVPAVPAANVPQILARFPGCTTAKVKVAERGQTLDDDIERVRAVRAALGPGGLLRIDANGGWDLAEAARALAALAEFDLDYAEQPCASVAELAELRGLLVSMGPSGSERTPGADALGDQPAHEPSSTGSPHGLPLVRIAADESVRKAADPLAVARAGAADLLVIKAQPLGGIGQALSVVEQAGLPVIVSSALDTSAGIAMGLQLAAALPAEQLAGACGLGTVALLDGDVTADPLLPVDGEIVVRRPALDPAALDRYAADAERTSWWIERITRCYRLLTQD